MEKKCYVVFSSMQKMFHNGIFHDSCCHQSLPNHLSTNQPKWEKIKFKNVLMSWGFKFLQFDNIWHIFHFTFFIHMVTNPTQQISTPLGSQRTHTHTEEERERELDEPKKTKLFFFPRTILLPSICDHLESIQKKKSVATFQHLK